MQLLDTAGGLLCPHTRLWQLALKEVFQVRGARRWHALRALMLPAGLARPHVPRKRPLPLLPHSRNKDPPFLIGWGAMPPTHHKHDKSGFFLTSLVMCSEAQGVLKWAAVCSNLGNRH